MNEDDLWLKIFLTALTGTAATTDRDNNPVQRAVVIAGAGLAAVAVRARQERDNAFKARPDVVRKHIDGSHSFWVMKEDVEIFQSLLNAAVASHPIYNYGYGQDRLRERAVAWELVKAMDNRSLQFVHEILE